MTTSIKQKAPTIFVGTLLMTPGLAPVSGVSSAHAAAQETNPPVSGSTQVKVVVTTPTSNDDNNSSVPDIIVHAMGNWGG